nr:hypothetical protein CFP56_50429 [Quercus suber]
MQVQNQHATTPPSDTTIDIHLFRLHKLIKQSSIELFTMLSRPATKISLTAEDVTAYEQRRMARDAIKDQQHLNQSSQDTTQSTVEDLTEEDVTPAQQTRAAKAKASREQRIGLGTSRS